ncbi:MAG: AzlD domain-containing protein [Bauldia sp.]|nr:AzlD domain-containing protein [Bauldia sp.]MCB1504023.1 AzlD domain-containing protein [Hyphomicrobiaceae bacterium]
MTSSLHEVTQAAGAASGTLPTGLTLALILTVISLATHEPWRWLGLILGRNIDVDSELFRWVRAVSTALVAALVTRLVVFPAGALGGVPLLVRVLAMLCGLGVYLLFGRRISFGVVTAAVVLVAGQSIMGP